MQDVLPLGTEIRRPNIAVKDQEEGGVLASQPVSVVWDKNASALIDLRTVDWLLNLEKGLLGNEVYGLARDFGASDDRASALKRLYRVRTTPYVITRIAELRPTLPQNAS